MTKQIETIVAFVGRRGRAAQILSAWVLGGVAGLAYGAALWVLVAVVVGVKGWMPPWLATVAAGALGGAVRKAPLGALVAVIVIAPIAVAYTWGNAAQGSWWIVAAAIVFTTPAGALGGAVGKVWFGSFRGVGDKVDAAGEETSGGQPIRFLDRFVPRIEVNNWFLGFVISSCVLIGTYCFYQSGTVTTCTGTPQPSGGVSLTITHTQKHLPVTQRFLEGWVVFWLAGEVFLLRLLGFRTTQILIPLVVLLGMMFCGVCSLSGGISHSAEAGLFVFGIVTLMFSGAVIVSEVVGRCLGR